MVDPGNGPGGPVPGSTGGSGQLRAGRAAVVIVVAIVLGVLLLQVGNRPVVQVEPTAGGGAPTTGTSAPTTTTTVARADVAVLVENGTTVPNAAGTYTTYLQQQGWKLLPATDTTSPVSTSVVYYVAGQSAGAAQLSDELGLPASAVQALTSAAPVGTTTGADVVLVLGTAQAGHLPTISSG